MSGKKGSTLTMPLWIGEMFLQPVDLRSELGTVHQVITTKGEQR